MRLINLESISVGDATVRGLQGCAVALAPMRNAGLEVRGLLVSNVCSGSSKVANGRPQQVTVGVLAFTFVMK
jgi:hypothetical protein